MKKIITIIAAVIVIAAVVGFMSITKAPSAPTTDINTAADQNQTAPVPETIPTYKISQSESKVSFSIGETLREKPFTAVGTTDQVAGDILVLFDEDTGGTYLAADNITVNAKTFKTDDEKRDGAIARMILKSEDPANEFITFKATSIGLPDAPAGDTPLQFSVIGNLTISGVTKQVTFTGTFMGTAEKMTVHATAKIKRSDFNLKVPELPFIADVADEFTISADIVANRAQ